MKKTAIIIDFNPKMAINTKANFDYYIIDRYNNKISCIETTSDNVLKEKLENEMSFLDFYQIIARNYQQIFCLFLSYDYTNIDDYLLTKSINQTRKKDEAKIYTYLLNYKNEFKKEIINNMISMIEKDYDIKDVIIHIHQIRKVESFSLNEFVMKYLAYY